jgi:hypothetical protein
MKEEVDYRESKHDDSGRSHDEVVVRTRISIEYESTELLKSQP